MGQSEAFQGANTHQIRPNRSGDGDESAQATLLSQCLTSEGGHMRLNIPRHVLPDFLVEANAAVNSGLISRASELVSTDNVERACYVAAENPSCADVIYLMLGVILQRVGRLKDALGWYERILEHQDHALVANEIATIYQTIGRYSKVAEYRTKAVEMDPQNIGIWSNLAVDMMVLGKTRQGIELLRRTLDKDPTNSAVHSNLLWYMHYLPGQDPQELFEEHLAWGRMQAPAELARQSHPNEPDPDRRLRVGYLCPDFRLHPTANTFHQFLDGHDREVVEVFGYGNVVKPDQVTEQLKQRFDCYRNAYGLEDRALADLIEQDKIDILVEIGGHVGNNRLVAMAYKPAPIQVDCGGINTSGMEQIDYSLADELLAPPYVQKYFVEELVYLPHGLYCFKPADYAPPVAPLPAERKGHVTFGSFNNTLKANEYIVSVWAEVLKANPDSRFLMKIGGGHDPLLSEYYFNMFERHGVSRERVEIHNWKLPVEHLKLYGEVDIVLDTYPVNGAMTMLEGLWMGVPAVSLAGKQGFLSRMGLSILSRIGLEFFAASTPEEYVAKATALAQNLPALAKIRASMRQRMECSPLRDATAFARGLEDAYRKMWHRWCRSQGVDVPDEGLTSEKRTCAGGTKTTVEFASETKGGA